MMAVASLEYLAGHGEPRTRRDLRRHRCLLGYTGDALTQTKGGLQHVQDAFYTNDINLLTDAARRGLGIAMLPPMCARPLMETGSLAQVLPGVLETDSEVAVVYAEREFVSSQVRAFVDAL